MRPKAYKNDIRDYRWLELKDGEYSSTPKIMPVWIPYNGKVDLVYLTEKEDYFVSTDKKRVYPTKEIKYYLIPEIPTILPGGE